MKNGDDFTYEWLGHKRRDLVYDVTEHGDEYVYDYQDYYENNLGYEPFRDEYSEDNEAGTHFRETGKKKVRPGQFDHKDLLTTSAPLILDFKFNNDRLKVMRAQQEMFDRIMDYSSQI